MCKTKHCRAKPKRSGLCWPCYNKRSHKANPVRYAYQTLKDNAKRRGIEFTISLSYFKAFCTRTDYIAGKGRTSESYTVERKDPRKGYEVGNLKCLTMSENGRKGATIDKKILNYDYRYPEYTRYY